MIGLPPIGALQKCVISGVADKGLTVTTATGMPAQLAIVDQNGRVIEVGPQVAKEAWSVTLNVYKNYLIGLGHLKVLTKQPEIGFVDRKIRYKGIPSKG